MVVQPVLVAVCRGKIPDLELSAGCINPSAAFFPFREKGFNLLGGRRIGTLEQRTHQDVDKRVEPIVHREHLGIDPSGVERIDHHAGLLAQFRSGFG